MDVGEELVPFFHALGHRGHARIAGFIRTDGGQHVLECSLERNVLDVLRLGQPAQRRSHCWGRSPVR